jgi:hypothetical protein
MDVPRSTEPGLIRYWITFDYAMRAPEPGLNLDGPDAFLPRSCGVTAFDFDDAIRIVAASFFTDRPVPTIAGVIEDVDVSTLDLPYKYSPPIWRGIWYPALSEELPSGPTVDDDTLRAIRSRDISPR